MWVTARRFAHGGIFDPDVGSGHVWIGPQSQPPTYNESTGRVANHLVKTRVVEGTWSAVHLQPGDYWLWSGGGDVVVRSCEGNGLSEPMPIER